MKRNGRIRILFMVDFVVEAPQGGTETQLFHLLRGLNRCRFQPSLCYLWPNPCVSRHHPPCEYTILFCKPIRWFSIPFSIARIRNFLRAGEFDIVHTYFPTSNVLGVVAARLGSVPVILSSRRDLGYWRKQRDKVMLRAVRNIPTAVIANSLAVKSEAVGTEGIAPKKVVVVYNGVDASANDYDYSTHRSTIRSNSQIPPDALVVGTVANYDRTVKGIQYFVDAAGHVAAEIPNAFFIIVGHGPADQENVLRRRVRQRGLDSQFVFAGSQEDVRPFIAAFDVAVLPSLSEGFSNSLLEYMAAGLPCVATDVGGNGELVTDGESGFLVKPGSPRALAEKVLVLLKDEDLRERMGRNAQLTVTSRFSIEKMICAYERLYEDLYSRRCRQRAPAVPIVDRPPTSGKESLRASCSTVLSSPFLPAAAGYVDRTVLTQDRAASQSTRVRGSHK